MAKHTGMATYSHTVNLIILHTSLGITYSPTWRSNSWTLAPHGARTEARRVSSIT